MSKFKKYLVDFIARLVIIAIVVISVFIIHSVQSGSLKLSCHFPESEDILVTAVKAQSPQFFGFCQENRRDLISKLSGQRLLLE